MNRKSNLVTYMIVIAIIGVFFPVISSSLPLGAIVEKIRAADIKVLLDNLNLWMGLIAIGGLFIYWIYRAARRDDQDE